MWNCLWKAGASIPHGHAQVSLTRGMHYAKIEALRRSAEIHRLAFERDYFEEWHAVHRDLGLATAHRGVRVLANLTPVKEKEIVLLGARLDAPLASAIYTALHSLIDRLGVTSFNLVIYLPPLVATGEDWGTSRSSCAWWTAATRPTAPPTSGRWSCMPPRSSPPTPSGSQRRSSPASARNSVGANHGGTKTTKITKGRQPKRRMSNV